MHVISKAEKQQFGHILEKINNDKVRYFYLMLGSALAERDRPEIATSSVSNTSPEHIANLRLRLNGL